MYGKKRGRGVPRLCMFVNNSGKEQTAQKIQINN